MNRTKLQFPSGGGHCSAWHYTGGNGACVVMASGGGVTKEPGTDRFADRFQAAGFSVLALDFRHFGESSGRPRQVIRTGAQLTDLAAAVEFARTLPGVDADKVVAWGFSLAGGHVLRLARKVPLAAVIAQTPLVDGIAATPNALRHETLGVVLRFPFIAARDVIGGLFGRPPTVVPLTGPRGSVAMLTTPDAQDAPAALNAEGRYLDWNATVAARSVMRLMCYRPCRGAARIPCPVLIVVAEDDRSALAGPAIRVADRAPRAQLVRIRGGHYAPFLGAFDEVVTAELAFLDRQLVAGASDVPA